MSLVKQALVEELKDLVNKAVEYKRQADTAKTEVKRDHFMKKLKKNNKKAMVILRGLNQIDRQSIESTSAGGDKDEGIEVSGSEGAAVGTDKGL